MCEIERVERVEMIKKRHDHIALEIHVHRIGQRHVVSVYITYLHRVILDKRVSFHSAAPLEPCHTIPRYWLDRI